MGLDQLEVVEFLLELISTETIDENKTFFDFIG
jgi:hypothetical protein